MAGGPVVRTVAATGPALLLVGVAAALAGHYPLQTPFNDLLGIAAGEAGNPAIPAFGARLVRAEQVSAGQPRPS